MPEVGLSSFPFLWGVIVPHSKTRNFWNSRNPDIWLILTSYAQVYKIELSQQLAHLNLFTFTLKVVPLIMDWMIAQLWCKVRAVRLTEILIKISRMLRQVTTLAPINNHPPSLAFWLSNATEFRHFLASDKHIHSYATEALVKIKLIIFGWVAKCCYLATSFRPFCQNRWRQHLTSWWRFSSRSWILSSPTWCPKIPSLIISRAQVCIV